MHRGGATRSPRTARVKRKNKGALIEEFTKVRQAVKDKCQQEQSKRHIEAVEEAKSKVRKLECRREEMRGQQEQEELSSQNERNGFGSELAALQALVVSRTGNTSA
mmetsp:Transcript_46576/g.108777  ORF Transcript_46576/g.108777 Transcript_46576/m.108777 type:complete len:106 (+) Transcript_46576:429-746(+)